jgi:hypothetical protein
MNNHENPTGEARLFGLYLGTVFARNDPKRLGRVRVAIPGLIEPASAWAFPLGSSGGGIGQRGKKRVPKKDAEVAVLFAGGNPDRPFYLVANWGEPGGVNESPGSNLTPEAIDEGGTDELNPEDDPDVHYDETDAFLITVDERAGKSRLQVRHKVTGDLVEYDGKAFAWLVRATTAVDIKCDGIVNIEGNQVQINGRIVQAVDGPI